MSLPTRKRFHDMHGRDRKIDQTVLEFCGLLKQYFNIQQSVSAIAIPPNGAKRLLRNRGSNLFFLMPFVEAIAEEPRAAFGIGMTIGEAEC